MKTRIYRYLGNRRGQGKNGVRWPEIRFTYNQNHHDPLTWSIFKRIFLLFLFFVFLIAPIEHGECQDDGKVLVLGVRADAPPFSSFSIEQKETPDQAKGFTVDLCNRIAKRAVKDELYCRYIYKQVGAADRFEALKNGEINMLCGASTVTLERMRVADFSVFTFLSGASVMYREKKAQKNNRKNGPLWVGVLEKTTTESQVDRIMADLQKKNQNFDISAPGSVKVQTVENHYQGLEKLKKDEIIAYVADREILLALRQKDMWDNGTTDIVVSEDYYTLEPYAIGIEIDNSELRYVANSVLSELYDLDRPGKEHEHIFTVLSNNFPRKRFSNSLEVLYRLQRITRGQKILGPAQKAKCQ